MYKEASWVESYYQLSNSPNICYLSPTQSQLLFIHPASASIFLDSKFPGDRGCHFYTSWTVAFTVGQSWLCHVCGCYYNISIKCEVWNNLYLYQMRINPISLSRCNFYTILHRCKCKWLEKKKGGRESGRVFAHTDQIQLVDTDLPEDLL